MMMTVEAPDRLFAEAAAPPVLTRVGVMLEAVEDEPAGPWLAAVLDSVDVGSLSEFDLPVYLRACGRLEAWAASRTWEGVAELASRSGAFGADKEISIALREPIGAAQRRMWMASRWRRLLPKSRALFRRGDLTEKQVEAVVEATGQVSDPELLARVEETAVTSERIAKTARELRRAVRQTLTRLDPKGAQDRARAARDEADVALLPDEDGMATVVVSAPVEQAVTIKTAADAYAATRKSAGDQRRVGMLRAEGLARVCGDYLSGASTLGAQPSSGGRPIEIGIVIGLETALGRRDLPGEVPGHGIVPREVIAEMVATELPRLRLMVIDENTGRLVYRAVEGYRPKPEQVAQVRVTCVFSVGPGSQVTADRTDTDHPIPYPEGETVIGNLVPNDRVWHNGHTNKQLTVTVDDTGTVTWTSVLGQTRTVTPYDYRLEPQSPGHQSDDDPPPF